MKKPSVLPMKRLATHITELNKYLPIFPIYNECKNMEEEKLNDIIFHAVPNSWVKQSYSQVWYFEAKSYRYSHNNFERMETVEKSNKGVTPS